MVRPLGYVLSLKPITLTSSICTAALGISYAYYQQGAVDLYLAALTLLGVVIAQCGVNLFNDYQDYISGADVAYRRRGVGARGIHIIIDMNVSPHTVRQVSLVLLAAALCIGIYIAVLTTPYVLVLAAAGALVGVAYSKRPISFRYRGLGEPLAGLCMGPLLCLGSYMVQTCSFSLIPLALGLPNGLITTMILILLALIRRDVDLTIGKMTIACCLGTKEIMMLLHSLNALAYLTVILLVAFNLIPALSLASLAALLPSIAGIAMREPRGLFYARIILTACLVVPMVLS